MKDLAMGALMDISKMDMYLKGDNPLEEGEGATGEEICILHSRKTFGTLGNTFNAIAIVGDPCAAPLWFCLRSSSTKNGSWPAALTMLPPMSHSVFVACTCAVMQSCE